MRAAPAAGRGWRSWGAAGALAALVLLPARAQGDDITACLQSRLGPAQTAQQCTAALEQASLAPERRAALLVQRGLARMSGGQLDAARGDFDAALALDGNSAWAYNARAVHWMQRGDTGKAIADYEQAVRLRPGYALAWANLGGARLVRGDLEGALANLDEAVRLAAVQKDMALAGRGRVRLARGEFALARDDFTAALAANAASAGALVGRAFAQFCLGEFDRAAEDFAAELRLHADPDSAVERLIALRRGGHDTRDELAQLLRHADEGQGLPTALALVSARITPEQALQATADRDPRLARRRRCTVGFAAGEWSLLGGDAAGARRSLVLAREACDPSQGEYAAAGAELARLPN